MKYRYHVRKLVLVVLIAGVTLAACGAATSRQTAPPASAAPAATRAPSASSGAGAMVNVATSEFAFALDTPDVAAGPVTFAVNNAGQAQHDFEIKGAGLELKTDMLEPGGTASLQADLEPGTYSYRCTVGGHEMLGMKGTFTVSG
jgi:uncharacterized cupredoxin-like copper-binding protein